MGHSPWLVFAVAISAKSVVCETENPLFVFSVVSVSFRKQVGVHGRCEDCCHTISVKLGKLAGKAGQYLNPEVKVWS